MSGRWVKAAGLTAGATLVAMAGLGVPAGAVSSGTPGDPTIVLDVNDSAAGGTYEETFKQVYAGTTPTGTDVFIYVPNAYALGSVPTGVRSMDPLTDWNPGDEFVPCAEKSPGDYVLTQEQLTYMGDELADHILAIDEDHFGEVGLAKPGVPESDALVMIVYDLHDEGMYDCEETTYTAGYFAPDYIASAGMNVMAVDAFDWANRIGDQAGNPNGRSELYEGVVAHELEHLLHNYSDPGELSWVDEGLADLAIFFNGYDVGGSHLTYHQVFHRETSLTRWGGGLENYGASYTYFQYLWEQAGGNGDGTYNPDSHSADAAGDLLIKMIFAEQGDGMVGVQAAIDDFNAETGAGLRSAKDLFKDWAIAVYLDTEGSDLWDIKAVDFGDPAYTRWTIDIANDTFWDGRGYYKGATPEAKWDRSRKRPDPTALPFGTSYEVFRNPGPTFSVDFAAEASTVIAPHTGDSHWYAGYASQSDHLLLIPGAASGDTVDFWTWYFIEEGWDYGFLEAQVGGEWVTVPMVNDENQTVTTDDDPHGNNTEGNGLTGTSGGAYFVDDPTYVHLSASIPAGATDVRMRYSTDAAYLDTGWFVDDVKVNGAEVTPEPDGVGWFSTNGAQDNDWSVQLVAACDLTPGVDGPFELVDSMGSHVYRLSGAQFTQGGFSTQCANTTKRDVAVVLSNLPSGDLDVLDADYAYRLVLGGNSKK